MGSSTDTQTPEHSGGYDPFFGTTGGIGNDVVKKQLDEWDIAAQGTVAPKRTEESGVLPLPAGLMIANFIRFYGYDAWYNPSYPTTDKIVPHMMFFHMFSSIQNIEARERLNITHATFHSGAIINGADKAAIKRISDMEFDLASGR